MTVAITLAWVMLFGFRIALEWLANKYEFFQQWLLIVTVALIVITLVLVLSLTAYILKLFHEVKSSALLVKGGFPQTQLEQQALAQPITAQYKKGKELTITRAERRAQKAAAIQAYRDRVHRVEAYEKRFRLEMAEKIKNDK